MDSNIDQVAVEGGEGPHRGNLVTENAGKERKTAHRNTKGLTELSRHYDVGLDILIGDRDGVTVNVTGGVNTQIIGVIAN